jgi:hypothetical protein
MKLLFYSLITSLNISILTAVIYGSIKSNRIEILPLYMTMINFACCTFYFIAKLIKNIKSSENNFFNYLENILCKFFFTTAMSVCTGYWLLSLAGTGFMPMSRTWSGFITNVYVHGIIGIMMLLEVFFHKREHHEHLYYRHLAVILALGTIYFTIINLFAELVDITVYPFLKLDVKIRVGVFLVLTMLSFNSYQLYHFILKKRFREQNQLLKYCLNN